jgi:hypothetical protein
MAEIDRDVAVNTELEIHLKFTRGSDLKNIHT